MSQAEPETTDGLLTLDELCERVGMSVRNVRFYTTKGLVPPPIAIKVVPRFARRSSIATITSVMRSNDLADSSATTMIGSRPAATSGSLRQASTMNTPSCALSITLASRPLATSTVETPPEARTSNRLTPPKAEQP